MWIIIVEGKNLEPSLEYYNDGNMKITFHEEITNEFYYELSNDLPVSLFNKEIFVKLEPKDMHIAGYLSVLGYLTPVLNPEDSQPLLVNIGYQMYVMYKVEDTLIHAATHM